VRSADPPDDGVVVVVVSGAASEAALCLPDGPVEPAPASALAATLETDVAVDREALATVEAGAPPTSVRGVYPVGQPPSKPVIVLG